MISRAVSDEERAHREAAFTRCGDKMRERRVLHFDERLHSADTATIVRGWNGGDVLPVERLVRRDKGAGNPDLRRGL